MLSESEQAVTAAIEALDSLYEALQSSSVREPLPDELHQAYSRVASLVSAPSSDRKRTRSQHASSGELLAAKRRRPEPAPTNHWCSMSDELQGHIMKHCDATSLCNLEQVPRYDHRAMKLLTPCVRRRARDSAPLQ